MDDEFRAYIEKISGQFEKIKEDIPKTSVFARFGDLKRIGDCSRKLPLLSDQNYFYENITHTPESRGFVIKSAHYSGVREVSDSSTHLITNDLEELYRWFQASKEMLLNGRITYLPYLISRRSYTVEERGLEYSTHNDVIEEMTPKKLFNAVTESDIKVSDPTVIPLLNLDIPYLESITPSQLFRLMEDYPDQLLSFRNYLQHSLLDFQSALGSESFYREVHALELDLKDRLAKLRSDIKGLKRTSLLEVIGANAVTWTLYVFVFMKSPDDLVKVLLPGGVVSSVSLAYAKYLNEMMKLKNTPLYFLFLVSQKTGRL
ncbi:MAG: hypothetical protein HPY59_02330 [Anaerolineae bacterium]|nr:hypothetical protein [Anaerolineae bacterium]